MHDANGTPLKTGDGVVIPCKITALCEGNEEFCNVTVETILGRRPDGEKESFSAINTGQLVKVADNRSAAPAQIVREGRHTRVFVCDAPGAGGACHRYSIENAHLPNDPVVLGQVNFQNGPIQESGVNGVQNEDLLAIVIHRLRGFQQGSFSCRANSITLTKCEEALMWLESRTADRVSRGVEGKSMA